MTILWLVLWHVIFSLIYFYWRTRTSYSQAVCEFIICVSIPVFGILYLLLGNMLHKFAYNNIGESEYLKEKLVHLKVGVGAVKQYMANVIPLSDALYLDDVVNKRELLTNAIRQDTLTDHRLLFKAVRDNDREISHYAASMLTAMLENMETELFRLEQQLQAQPDNYECQIAYVEQMAEYLTIYLLEPLRKAKYLQQYRLVLWKLINSPFAKEQHYANLFDCELNLGNYVQAEALCQQYLQDAAGNEEPYLLYIKLYQHLKNYKALHQKLSELKSCPICLSPKALNIIRFWDRGGSNV